MLRKIQFSEKDELYVLGDVVDRGPEPIKVLQDGGQVTAEKFRALSYSDKMDVLDYIAGSSLYDVIENNGKEYRLVHAGLSNFTPDKEMYEYDLYDFLIERADYARRYYPDDNIFLVTGHTPTVFIDGWRKPEVYRKNGHIALDCACVAGGKLAAFCVETEEVIYEWIRKI